MTEKAKPRVAIIILNYNGIEDTLECLDSLKKCTYPNFEIVLVENGSNVGDVEKIGEIEMEGLSKIFNNENLGFAGGNNVAIRRIIKDGKCKYIYFLNNDTIVESDFLDWAVERAESDEKIGAVASLSIQYYDRRLVDNAGHDFLNSGDFSPRGRGSKVEKYQRSCEVMGVSGCGSLYGVSTLVDIGYFDESFFLYCEDSDLAMRCILYGWKCVYEPKSVMYHKISSTTKKVRNFNLILKTRNNATKAYVYNTPILVLLINFPFSFSAYFMALFGHVLFFDLDMIKALILSRAHFIRNIKSFYKINRERVKRKKVSSWYILKMQKFYIFFYWVYFKDAVNKKLNAESF